MKIYFYHHSRRFGKTGLAKLDAIMRIWNLLMPAKNPTAGIHLESGRKHGGKAK